MHQQPPKTLRLTFLITDLYLGGSPLILRDLAYGLASLIHPDGSPQFQITILSLKPLPPDSQSAFPKKVPHLKNANKPPKIKTLSLELEGLRTLPRALGRLRFILHTHPPDILYSILLHANLLATLLLPFLPPGRKPQFVQSLHTLQPNPRWHWIAQGLIAPFADALIVPSQPILDRIATFGPFQNGRVIPNGIDVDRFALAPRIPPPKHPLAPPSPPPLPPPNPPLDPLLPPPSPPTFTPSIPVKTIGFVGRLDPVKRLDLLLHALSLLRQTAPRIDWHLQILGYGPQEPALRSLATSLHLTPFVHFRGPVPDVENHYKSFDCLCLPSPVEGFGLVLAEALAAGIPVIAIDTPVTRTLVRVPRDGRLVKNLAPASLAHAIEEVTSLPHDPTGSQNHIREHFSLTSMINSHAKFLKNLFQ